jgi:hypothetical protein
MINVLKQKGLLTDGGSAGGVEGVGWGGIEASIRGRDP